jgi:hypothetical protein
VACRPQYLRLLVFDAAPQPLDEDVVAPRVSAVHAAPAAKTVIDTEILTLISVHIGMPSVIIN